MRPVDSRVLADPRRGDGADAAGVMGDCFRACLASLLELDLDDVPHAVHFVTWFDEVRRFMRAQIGSDAGCYEPRWPLYDDGIGRPVIASGPSPRGPWWHSVIVDSTTGELMHDPHPSRAGILEVSDVIAIVPAYDPPPGPGVDRQLETAR